MTLLNSALCFWDFQGETPLTSRGQYTYRLSEMNGPIKRADEGVFGPCSLELSRGQWLRILHKDCPALNIHGDQEVTVLAWIKRQTENEWQYIAGMWDEQNKARQYALFTSGHKQAHAASLDRSDALHQPHGYVSDVGGATPGKPFCFSYATGSTMVPCDQWVMLGFTYDHSAIRVYTNGELDRNADCNPFAWNKPIYHKPERKTDFTVGQRSVPSWPDYPQGMPGNKVGFGGRLGGLAVFDRALTQQDIHMVYTGKE